MLKSKGASAVGANRLLCLAILAALSNPVHAQLASSSAPTDVLAEAQGDGLPQEQAKTLDSVVVTAQHRSEDIQKIPTAITAVSGEVAKAQGKVTLQDAIENVPGVEFQQSNLGGGFYVRGIGSRLPSVDSPVSIFYDGIYQSRSELTNLGFMDVERIEVLRGPQGTLYGRNNSGGTVNIISHDPVLGQTSGSATLQVGNYDRIGTEAAINLPLNAITALRIAAGSNRHSGYLSNGLQDEDSKAARVKLLIQPSQDLRLLLSADYARNGGNGAGDVYLPTSSRGDAWYAPDYSTLSFAGTTVCGASGTPSCSPYQKTENKSIRAELDWNAGWSQITFLAGHQHYVSDYRQVFAYLLEDSHTPLSQSSAELRFASPDDSPVTWVGGLYWLKHDLSGSTVHNYSFNTGSQVYTGINTSKAAFGQATFPLATATRMTLGGRYTRDRFESSGISSGITNAASGEMSKFTYRAGIEHDIGARSMLFANVSTGYRQGGVGQSTNSGTVYTYDPETVTAYELGWKSKLLDNTLLLNADLFWYRYKGYQLTVNYYPDPAVAIYETRTTNVPGTSLIGGAEVEGRWLATAHDSVDFSAAYSYNDYADADVVLGASPTDYTNMAGREMPRMPKWKATLGYNHAWDLSHGTLTGRVGARYSTKYATDLIYFTYASPDLFIQRAYTTYDASLAYDELDGRYTVSLFGNNLSNRAIITQANAAGTNTLGVLNAPHTYGVSFTARF